MVFLGFLFIFLLRPVIIPVLLAVILVILLYPTYLSILKAFKGRAYWASLVATFLVFLLLILPSGLVVALVVNQAIDFASQLNVREAFSSLVSGGFYQDSILPLIERFENRFQIHIDFPALISQSVSETLRYLSSHSPQVVSGTASFIFKFIVMHFTMYFLFVDGQKVSQVILDLSPLQVRYENRLMGEFKNMIYATVYGYLATALVQAVLAWIGFLMAGVPAPLVFATLTFFMAMVPIIGATSVWLPIGLWLILSGNTGWGVFILIYGALAISSVDNIVKPLIMRGKARIHPLLIFFSIFGGMQLFGPIGLLFGPVILSLFFACIRIYREDFLNQGRSE